MNENINLVEILKNHEGETFYSPLCGECKLIKTNNSGSYPIRVADKYSNDWHFTNEGKYVTVAAGECLLFPSKDQRDWNVWLKEQEQKKAPKIWSEFIKKNLHKTYSIVRHENIADCLLWEGDTPIEKSALALLKIHQLIEHCYGGNITNGEWRDSSVKYIFECMGGCITVSVSFNLRNLIAFHTEEQAEEFMSYPENVELLKDYFMI